MEANNKFLYGYILIPVSTIVPSQVTHSQLAVKNYDMNKTIKVGTVVLDTKDIVSKDSRSLSMSLPK